MKKKNILPLFIAFIVFISLSSKAQETEQTTQKKEYRTLFADKDGHIEHGLFGGVNFAYSQIDAKPAMSIGGRLAWLINHKFALGLTGNGFFNNMQARHSNDVSDYFLAGGYGGLFIQPIIYPNSPVHVSFPIIFGVGGIVMESWEHIEYEDYNHGHYPDYYYDEDILLVFEPGIEVDFNLVKFMRMSIGASYRLTNDLILEYSYPTEDGPINRLVANKTAMNGFTFKLGMYFGKF